MVLKDDAKEGNIVLKFESFRSQQYGEETSRGWLQERMVRFELAIQLNGQCQTWNNIGRKIEILHVYSSLKLVISLKN